MDIYTDGRVDQLKVDTLLDDAIAEAMTFVFQALGARFTGSVEMRLRRQLKPLVDALVDAATSERAIADIERGPVVSAEVEGFRGIGYYDEPGERA